MKILMTPEDIIKRCLWHRYKKFVLSNKKKNEIIEIIEENELISLSEEDAYVIGLLKVIVTDNLVHRLRLEIENIVKERTTVNKDRVIINRNSVLNEILEFKTRFPIEYKTDKYYQIHIDEMKEYADKIYKEVSELEYVEILFKDKLIKFVYSKHVNKIIKFK